MNRHYLRESDWDDDEPDVSTPVESFPPLDYAPAEGEPEPMPNVIRAIMLALLGPYLIGVWWLFSRLCDLLLALAQLVYTFVLQLFV